MAVTQWYESPPIMRENYTHDIRPAPSLVRALEPHIQRRFIIGGPDPVV